MVTGHHRDPVATAFGLIPSERARPGADAAAGGPPFDPFDVEGPVLCETFVVFVADGTVRLTGPCGPAAWHVEVGPGGDPMAVVRRLLTAQLGEPLVLHSTSWRRWRESVVLSFVAVVRPEQADGHDSVAVERAALARGSEAAAPARVAFDQVLEHALRHLAWLVRDDPVVGAALDPAWPAALDAYVPEPFRALA